MALNRRLANPRLAEDRDKQHGHELATSNTHARSLSHRDEDHLHVDPGRRGHSVPGARRQSPDDSIRGDRRRAQDRDKNDGHEVVFSGRDIWEHDHAVPGRRGHSTPHQDRWRKRSPSPPPSYDRASARVQHGHGAASRQKPDGRLSKNESGSGRSADRHNSTHLSGEPYRMQEERPPDHRDSRRRSRSPRAAAWHRPSLPHSRREEGEAKYDRGSPHNGRRSDSQRDCRYDRSLPAALEQGARRNWCPVHERSVEQDRYRTRSPRRDLGAVRGNAASGPKHDSFVEQEDGRGRFDRGRDRHDVRAKEARHDRPFERDKVGRSSQDDVDIFLALERERDPEGIRDLLAEQRPRVALSHVSAAFDRLVALTDSIGNERPLHHIIDLLSEISMEHQSEFDRAFCHKIIWHLKKLKSKSPTSTIFLQAICNRLKDSFDSCTSVEISKVLLSIAEFGHELPVSFWESVSKRSIELVSHCDLRSCSDILYSIAKLKQHAVCAQLIRRLSEHVSTLLHEQRDYSTSSFESKDLSNVLWAFATFGDKAESWSLLDAVLYQLPNARNWKAQNVVNCLWSFAMMGHNVDDSILDFLGERTTQGLWKSYTPQNISNTFWAYATLKKMPSKGLADVMARRGIETMRNFTSQPLSNLFWGLAVLQSELEIDNRFLGTDKHLVSRMCERALEFDLDRLHYQEVSGIMWSIATLHKDVNGVPTKLRPEAQNLFVQMAGVLPKLAQDAPPFFLAHTLHAMASISIWNKDSAEDDTTHVRRRQADDASQERLRLVPEEVKVDVFNRYQSRALTVIHDFEESEIDLMLWSIRTLMLDARCDLLMAFTNRLHDVGRLDHYVVDIMWTYAVLWLKPDPSVGMMLATHAEAWAARPDVNLLSVTRLLWAMAAFYMQQAHCDVKWGAVLDKLAVVLLAQERALNELNFRQLHQFFLTCNTCVDLVDILPDSMFQVKERLESKCIVHVRETSKAQYLEHSLGRGCAMQLEKLGFHVEIEQECPNSGYNLDMYLLAKDGTPVDLWPPPIEGHRGWVMEIDRDW
jgi:hypothetical protein